MTCYRLGGLFFQTMDELISVDDSNHSNTLMISSDGTIRLAYGSSINDNQYVFMKFDDTAKIFYFYKNVCETPNIVNKRILLKLINIANRELLIKKIDHLNFEKYLERKQYSYLYDTTLQLADNSCHLI